LSDCVKLGRRALLTAGLALAAPRPARAAGKLSIAFVYGGPVANKGYNYQHDLGRQAIDAKFGDAVTTHYVENVPVGPDCERILRQLAAGGDGMIVSTSFDFMNSVVRVAKEFPEVKFEQATGYRVLPNMAEFNLRFYEGRAVCGTLAGTLSRTGTAGYVGSFPIPQVIMGVNAFTLAAQKINPAFKTRIVWLDTWVDPGREADAAKSLIDQGADVLADHMDSSAVMATAQARGVMAFGYSSDRKPAGPTAQLTAIIDNWAPYYVGRVQAALNGSWKSGNVSLGIEDGALALAPHGPLVTAPARAAAEKVRMGIAAGTVNPFTGPITDQSGTLRVPAGVVLSEMELQKMDWLVRGVV
jgi:simple sugar transport system substrate-binding protein